MAQSLAQIPSMIAYLVLLAHSPRRLAHLAAPIVDLAHIATQLDPHRALDVLWAHLAQSLELFPLVTVQFAQQARIVPQLADRLAHSACPVFTAQLLGQPPLVLVLLVLLAHIVLQVVHLPAHNALQARLVCLVNSPLPCALVESPVLQARTQLLELRRPLLLSQVCALLAVAPSLHR